MLKLRKSSESDRRLWNEYVAKHGEGLVYHFYGWLTAVAQAYAFKTVGLIAEDGDRIRGILPTAHVRWPFCRGTLVSLPYCDAAGPLADEPGIKEALLQETLRLQEEVGARRVEIRSFTTIPGGSAEGSRTPNKVRMVLPLPGDLDKLMGSFKAKLRSQIRKPMRDGLIATLGGLELLDDFYLIFSENMRDLGSPAHSKRWLRSVLHAYDGNGRIGLVRLPDGTPAAGGVILCHPETVFIPWASSLRRFNSLNPNMLLYWTFLEYAVQTGHRFFDFGRSTPGEGTYRFKTQWGARPRPIYWECFEGGKNESRHGSFHSGGSFHGEGVMRQKVEAMIRRTPVLFARTLGTMLRRYVTL